MAAGILGKKLGMTQMFDSDGSRIPVTLIDTSSCIALKKKMSDGNDGYNAVVLGFNSVKKKSLNKPKLGFLTKHELPLRRNLKEIRLNPEEFDLYEKGKDVTPDIFSAGEKVDVTGLSKGRGFQGVVKRHGMKGQKRSRGAHEFRRHVGSIGSNTWPGRTIPGKRMPGHHGNTTVTVQNLIIMKVEPDQNLLVLKGAIPGHNNSIVVVKKAVKSS